MMIEFTVLEKYELFRFTNTLQNLLAMDRLWTESLSSPVETPITKEAMPIEARQALLNIGKDIIGFWENITQHANVIEIVLARLSNSTNGTIAGLVRDCGLDEHTRQQFHEYAERHGGYLAATRKAIVGLVQHSEAESEAIKRKMHLLSAGEWVPGDMSHTAECGVLFAAAILLTLTAVAPLAAVGIGGFIGRGCVNQ
jgi:hypothetical protein